MCLCACGLILIGKVVLNLLAHIFRYIFMMEQFEDGLCLLNIYTEELSVLIDALWVKGFMQGFLNFDTVTFLDLACKLTFKRDRNTCCI